jgi:hypothetical protein
MIDYCYNVKEKSLSINNIKMESAEFEYSKSITSQEIIDHIFSGLLKDHKEKPKIYLVGLYLSRLSYMIDLLEKCKTKNKIAFLKFEGKDSFDLIVECEVINVSSSFVVINTILLKHGDSIDGTKTEKKFYYVGVKSFLTQVSISNTSLDDVKIFVDE